MKKFAGWLCALSVVGLLTGCGKSLDGTYAINEGGVSSSLQFKSGGKVIQSMMGVEVELDYKIEGDKIKISNGQGGNMLLTLLPDGSIKGPMGLKYVKQQ